MYQSFVLAAISATVIQAAPGRGGAARAAKKKNDLKFQAFASKYNKDISDTATFALKQERYHATDAMINAQNAKAPLGSTNALRYEHNMFSDMSPEDFKNYMGLNENIPHDDPIELPMHRPGGRHLQNRRQSVNWYTTDNDLGAKKMFDVKNQGSCGSCWAFAVTSTLEGTLAIKSNSEPFRISEQQGVDCTLAHSQGGSYNKQTFGNNVRDYGCWGCEGCWMANHYNFLKDWGAMRNSDYQYEAKQLGECNHKFDKVVGKVASYTRIRDSVDDMVARVRQQPLDVAVCASGWSNVGSGIMKRSDGCCTGLNHAVTIVGYKLCDGEEEGNDNNDNDEKDNNDGDVEPGPAPACEVDKWWYSCNETAARRLQDTCIPYWIVQNSWGTWWGDGGFIKIEMTDGVGVCGINEVVEYADWTSDMYA